MDPYCLSKHIWSDWEETFTSINTQFSDPLMGAIPIQ
jgi:hypothetical protein